nr:hypothetical protein Iba_chr05cCG10810 [Ipomoea batatas]
MPPESGFLLGLPRATGSLLREQPPERGIIDAAREWVSTRIRRISFVDGVPHRTAQLSTANAASSSIAHCRQTCRAKKRERTLGYCRIASRNFPLLMSPIGAATSTGGRCLNIYR